MLFVLSMWVLDFVTIESTMTLSSSARPSFHTEGESEAERGRGVVKQPPTPIAYFENVLSEAKEFYLKRSFPLFLIESNRIESNTKSIQEIDTRNYPFHIIRGP